jgi:hypothetical protein
VTQDFYWNRHWDFRRGSKRIVVEWDGGSADAIVYDDGVPRTTAAVLDALPVEIPVVHAIWSGDFLMSSVQYDLGLKEAENATRLPRPGDLSWDHAFGELGFTYGTAECRMPSGTNTVVVYGQMVSGIDAFASYGRSRRFEGLGHIRLNHAL